MTPWPAWDPTTFSWPKRPESALIIAIIIFDQPLSDSQGFCFTKGATNSTKYFPGQEQLRSWKQTKMDAWNIYLSSSLGYLLIWESFIPQPVSDHPRRRCSRRCCRRSPDSVSLGSFDTSFHALKDHVLVDLEGINTNWWTGWSSCSEDIPWILQ